MFINGFLRLHLCIELHVKAIDDFFLLLFNVKSVNLSLEVFDRAKLNLAKRRVVREMPRQGEENLSTKTENILLLFK